MPKKLIRSKEYRENLSKAMKKAMIGNKNGRGNKGKIHTYEQNRKNGLSKVGNKNMLGKHHSLKSKRKISKSRRGKCVGENHPHWKGGITPIHNKIRGSIAYKSWEYNVKHRDCNCCQKCGENRIKYIMVHHVLNFSNHPELRFTISNGITFCRLCHKEFHKKYGKKNNTREQIKEFLL